MAPTGTTNIEHKVTFRRICEPLCGMIATVEDGQVVDYRTVVGSDLPFSITGPAAPPFRKPMKCYADVQLRLARRRTHRRLDGRSGANS